VFKLIEFPNKLCSIPILPPKGIENVRFNLMLGKKAEDTTDNRNGVKNNLFEVRSQ
jgi:hypothetical protein